MNTTLAKVIFALLSAALALGVSQGLSRLDFYKQASPFVRFVILFVAIFVPIFVLHLIFPVS